jgi:hypothetical protein
MILPNGENIALFYSESNFFFAIYFEIYRGKAGVVLLILRVIK